MARITIEAHDKLLDTYYKTLDDLQNAQDVKNEGGTRRAFGGLLEAIGKKRKWILVEEAGKKSTRSSRTVYPDGTLRDTWKLPHAYWEAKDTDDDLDAEIDKKKGRGYPLDNIIFEDTQTAVLYQDGAEEYRSDVRDRERFATLLTRYVNHEIEPFEDFEDAITSYSKQVKGIAESLKEKIEGAHQDKNNKKFQNQFADFMEVCRSSLNPNISQAAVDEMLIQHLMTERIIRRVFNVERFTRTNVIAAEIEKVIDALTSQHFDRKDFLGALDRFYRAIESAADKLANFQDKQHFINTVYERFFQGYSVKVADTHGIVYTPQEIVDFMCAAVEEVLQDEFGKKLGDEGVYLIDPATGTGNFIINLLRRAFERNPRNFEQFYKERLFANEVMLMPYYIASLNIEHEFYELTGKNESFEGICFVDTLDLAKGKQMQFSFMTEENTKRVQRQQDAPITVIIGNPPYNVGQVNENDNNKNRVYDVIDKQVKGTYSKDSTASLNTKLYDPYVKFFRWATDRLGDRDGIVCMVTNNNFVEENSFDGMRQHLYNEFSSIYHLDLHGNVRKNTKLSGTTHNVFGIQVGVGITIAVRLSKQQEKKLYYHRVPEFWRKEEKLAFMTWHVKEDGSWNALNTIDWKKLIPDTKNSWLVPEFSKEFDNFISIGDKDNKSAKLKFFDTYSLGVSTNRDVIVYDFENRKLSERVKKFTEHYNLEVDRYLRTGKPKDVDNFVSYDYVKWSHILKGKLKRGKYAKYESSSLRNVLYRPFTKKQLYFDDVLIDAPSLQSSLFPINSENKIISLAGKGNRKLFGCLISSTIASLDLAFEKVQCFPFYTYDKDGSNQQENITDWALEKFRAQYKDETISKWDIFYYVYGLLHHPEYRERYADNLKRELPRIPFVPSPPPNDNNDIAGADRASPVPTNESGFWVFSKAGKKLAELHLNYETSERYELDWDVTQKPISYDVVKMKPKKKRDATDGNYKVYESLQFNDSLTLKGISEKAFGYRLGNRSALDWVVDQYRVKTDKRSGITSNPNGYSDDEQYIVQLVERVIQVSVETVDIVAGLAQVAFREESTKR
jgi:predicted helicase